MSWNRTRLAAIFLLVVCSAAVFDCACQAKNGSSEAIKSRYQKLVDDGKRVVSLDELETSLPSQPITVGFDVDDTVLFSSPGFYYGSTNTDGLDGGNLYGEDYLISVNYWKDMNARHEKYSIPKKIAGTLIELHKKRGDRILFITARPSLDGNTTALTDRLNVLFGLRNRTQVIYTNNLSKTGVIEANGVDLYYGDSDTDISDANNVSKRKVRPIRVLRSPLSTYELYNNPGKYNEEILLNSEN